MTGPWVVAFIVLTGLVLLLAALVLGLYARTLSTLDKMESVFGRINVDNLFRGLDIGTRIPYFTARHVSGPSLSDQVSTSGRLLLFFDEDCEPCAALAAALSQGPSSDDGLPVGIEKVLVGAADGIEPTWTLPDDWSVLQQQRREVSRLLSVSVTPYAYVIDSNSSVVAAGIPNSLEDLQSLASALVKEKPLSSGNRMALPVTDLQRGTDGQHREMRNERSQHVHG